MQRGGSRRPRDWSSRHHHGKALAIGPGRTAHRKKKRLTGAGARRRRPGRPSAGSASGRSKRDCNRLSRSSWTPAGKIPEEIPQPFIEPLKRLGLLEEAEAPDAGPGRWRFDRLRTGRRLALVRVRPRRAARSGRRLGGGTGPTGRIKRRQTRAWSRLASRLAGHSGEADRDRNEEQRQLDERAPDRV